MNERPAFIALIPGFAASESDTTCLPFVQSTLLALQRSRPDLEVIILAFHYPYTKSEYSWNGIQVIPFNGRNRGGLYRFLLRGKVSVRLNSIRKKRKIAGMLSIFCGECAITGKRFAPRYNIKHYCWIFGQDAKKDNPYPSRMKGVPKDFIALSDFLRDHFDISHGIRPYYMIPPGIENEKFEGNGIEKDIDIFAAGSLIPLKRYEVFIEVIGQLKNQFPSVNAVIAGDGPEKKKLTSLVKKLGLENNIILAGELPHPEVIRLMKRSRLFLHPSAYEGFGVVCLEALYAGASVISFTKPMNEEIPDWYQVYDTTGMVEKSIQILESNSKPGFPSAFSISNTVSKLLELY